MEKYGFVYIWYDRKHKRYYIGCRWGNENDGYVCSSTNMKHAYKKRKEDFKRRILSRIYTNKADLLEEEYRWLKQIKPNELKTRYYNLHNHHFGHWSTDENKTVTAKQRMSENIKKAFSTPEAKEKLSACQKKRFAKGNHPRIGIPHTEEAKAKIKEARNKQVIIHSEETRKKQSDVRIGMKFSDEHKKNLSESHKGQIPWMTGRKHSEETKEKMRNSKRKMNE